MRTCRIFQADLVLIKMGLYWQNFSLVFLIHLFLYAGVYCTTGPITKAEIRSAITSMKAGKAPGVDCLTVELLKADITTTVDVLHDLFCEIWVSETVPADWRRGLIVKIAKKGNLTNCGNWRGITLMSVAAKVRC